MININRTHDLLHELPEREAEIQALRKTNNHFAKLFQQYEDLNKDVLRIEKGAEAASDERLENLKKQRLACKDEMHNMLLDEK